MANDLGEDALKVVVPLPERSYSFLLVLCGLPGAGKSTVCRHMIESAPPGIHAIHLSFDEVEAEMAVLGQQGVSASRSGCDGDSDAFDADRWRNARKVSFQRLHEMLSTSLKGEILNFNVDAVRRLLIMPPSLRVLASHLSLFTSSALLLLCLLAE
jgi:hypothetical protein